MHKDEIETTEFYKNLIIHLYPVRPQAEDDPEMIQIGGEINYSAKMQAGERNEIIANESLIIHNLAENMRDEILKQLGVSEDSDDTI